jgi:hypothetical protein
LKSLNEILHGDKDKLATSLKKYEKHCNMINEQIAQEKG